MQHSLPAPVRSTDMVTEHFQMLEFAKSAEHPMLVSQVPVSLYGNVLCLCLWGLEPLREVHGAPLTVNSGFRSASLNRAVGGSDTSQHLRAEAVDVSSEKGPDALFDSVFVAHSQDLFRGLGQIILYPEQAFVHMALRSARYPMPLIHVHQPSLGLRYALLKEQSKQGFIDTIASAKHFTRGRNANR